MPIIATLFFVAITGFIMFDDTIDHTIDFYNGIVKGWSISHINNNIIGILLNNSIVLLTAILISHIAVHFRLIKEKTLLPLLFFLLFQLLTPTKVNQYEQANLISFIAILTVAILYSCYQEKHATEKGFIIATILSITSFIDAHILYLLPIIVVGIIQMQATSLRTFAAMIVGLIVPYWIIWGLGIVELSEIDFSALSISLNLPTIDLQILPFTVVIMIGLVTGIGNLYSAFNEKIYTRATNGFVSILSTYITLLLIIDNVHFIQYLPILNGCVALQASYFFSSHTKRTSTITLIALIVVLATWIGWMYWGNYPSL